MKKKEAGKKRKGRYLSFSEESRMNKGGKQRPKESRINAFELAPKS